MRSGGAIFLGLPREFVKLPPTAQIAWIFHQIFWEILGFPWMIRQNSLGNPRIFMDGSPKFPGKS